MGKIFKKKFKWKNVAKSLTVERKRGLPELYRVQEQELAHQIDQKDAEIESLKSTNHELEQKLADSSAISADNNQSDDEFIETLQAIKNEYSDGTFENHRLRQELEQSQIERSTIDEYERLRLENDNLQNAVEGSQREHENYLRLQDVHDQICKEKENAETQLAQMRQDRDSVTNEKAELLASLSQCQQELERLAAESSDHVTAAAQSERENERIRTLLDEQGEKFMAENEKLIERNEKLISEKEASDARFRTMYEDSLRDSSAEHERALSELNKEIESRGVLIVENRKEYEKQLESLQNQVDEHEATIEYLNDVVKTAQVEAESKAEEALEQINDVQSEAAKQMQECENLRSQVANLLKCQTELTGDIDRRDCELKTLRDEVESKTVAADELRAQLDQALLSEMDSKSAQNEAESLFASRVSEIEAARDEARIEKSALELSVKHLQEEKIQMQIELNKMHESRVDISSTNQAEREELESKLATAHAQKDKLADDLKLATDEIVKCQKEIETLHEKATRLEEAEAEIDLLSEQFESAETQFVQEREGFEVALKKSQEEIMNLVKDFEIYNVQLQDKDEQMTQLIAIKEKLQVFVGENDELKLELRAQYEKLAERNETIEEQENKINQCHRQIELLEGQVTSSGAACSEREEILSARNSALSIELSSAQSGMAAHRAKLADIEEQNRRLAEEAETLRAVRDEIENRLGEAKTESDSLKAKIETLEKETEIGEQKTEKADQEYKSLLAQFQQSESQLNQHKTDLQNSHTETQSMKTELDTLRSRADTDREKLDRLHERLLETQSTLENVEAREIAVKEALSLVEQSKSELEQRLSELTDEVEAATNQRTEMAATLTESQQVCTSLKAQLEQAQLDRTSTNQKLESSEAQTSQLVATFNESVVQPLMAEIESEEALSEEALLELPVSTNPDPVVASDLRAIESELFERENLIQTQNHDLAYFESQKERLEGELDSLRKALETAQAEKDKLVQELNNSQKEREQLADELVSQYNRFTSEKSEFEEQMKIAFNEKLEVFAQEKETEADELEQDFNLQIAEKVAEFNLKIQELNNEIVRQSELCEELKEKHKINLSNLQHDMSKARDEREDEMENLTKDLADLIPYAEELKEENQALREKIDELEEIKERSVDAEHEKIEILAEIQQENNRNEKLKRDVSQLTNEIEQKTLNEERLNGQILALKGTVERLSSEMSDYKRLNMSVNTQATSATEYIPIRISTNQKSADGTLTDLTPEDSILTEGSLPDSEIMEMDSKELENLKLRQVIKELEDKLKVAASGDDLDLSIPLAENESEMAKLEAKIEQISREREDQLCSKNEQICEIEAIREDEKTKAKSREEQLRSKIKELQAELDKKSGYEVAQDVRELNEKNDFLMRQAEEFAEELEKTINSEEELSKENIQLIQQLNELKGELDSLKSTTPERFERLVTGFGHERKEFDEMHEKVFEENEQLRKALVKIYSRVKDAMALASSPPAGLDQSQLEQRPIGDEEMELEEGLAATEQVIQLLDQIISQGEQIGLSPVKDSATREMRQMREELVNLHALAKQLEAEKAQLVESRLADANDDVRQMFETAQSRHYEEKKRKDDEIRELQDALEVAAEGRDTDQSQLAQLNADLGRRVEFLEKEIESKAEFIKMQTAEQESDRQAQDDRIQMLQLALDKIKDKNKVDFTIQLDERGGISSLVGSSTVPLADKIEQLERELEREKENQVQIQRDYNELCQKNAYYMREFQKLESAEEEARTQSNKVAHISIEKEQLADELKSAFDRISELETFIDTRIKFGNEKNLSKSNTSISLSQQNLNLSKSASNLRAFPDETRVNMSSSYSLQNVSDDLNSSPLGAKSHHDDLLEDLAEKGQTIENLEREIGELRAALEKAKSAPRGQPTAKKSNQSLLEELSERENQIYEKEEQIFQIQDELSDTKRENQKLKVEVQNLSRVDRRSSSSNMTTGESVGDSSTNATELNELTQKCKMQQQIIAKMKEQINLLRETHEDDENSLCELSMPDDLEHLSPRSTTSSRGHLPLEFESVSNRTKSTGDSSSAYRAQMERELGKKQDEINQLESVVGELNAELKLAQSKLNDLLHQNSASQMSQSEQIDKWRREQQESVLESKQIIQTLRDELERVNDDRELVIDQLDKLQRQTIELKTDREELKAQLAEYENETDQIKLEYEMKESEAENLKDELSSVTKSFANYQGLTEQIGRLKDELEHVRDLYKDAQDEITHLTQFKRDRAQLEAQMEQNHVLNDRVEHLEQESRDMDYEISQSRDLIEQLKAEKSRHDHEVAQLNETLIKSQMRQQEQQNTITELFQQIQTSKTELEHNQFHSRDNESKLVSAQTERLKELNGLKQEVAMLRSERETLVQDINQSKRRIDDLEYQLEASVKNHEMSTMGEELIQKLQRELDEQEELDEKLMGHLKEARSDQSPTRSGGRLQELLDKVHEEGLNVLSLSELHLLKGETDSQKEKDQDATLRRMEAKLEQEKIINKDIAEALKRERHRIHDQEKRAEGDKKTIEALQSQVAQSSRDLGEKCVEVSRCLAEIGVIKDELTAKSTMLEKTQHIVDALRKDSDHMRGEIEKFDQNVGSANRDYEELELCLVESKKEHSSMASNLASTRGENAELRIELVEAKKQLDRLMLEKSSSCEQLEHCVKQSREAEMAERKLNTALHRQLEIEQENVAKLRAEIRHIQSKVEDEASQTSDEVDSLRRKLVEFQTALEGARRATGEAQRERDRQCEEKLDLMAKHETLQKREKRVEQHVANLEQRLLNSSMHSDNSASDAEERGSLQSVRFGLEMARQQLSALSARLQVATVRADQSELEQCRTELTEQHRTLALMARTLNSTRSSKRAVETGILESRLKEQLASLESNSNRMAEMYNYASHDSGRVAELDRLADQQRRQIDSLNHDKVALQTKIDELKIVNSRLHAQGDANVENFGLSSAQAMSRKQQKTYERYVRAESSRKALVYQKKYLLLIIGGFQETESNTLRLISRMGGHPEPNAIAPTIPPKSRFKSAVRVVIAIQRLKFLTKKWQKTVTRSRSSSKEVVSGAFSLANGHRLSRPLMEYGKY